MNIAALKKEYGEVFLTDLGIILPRFPHTEEGMRLYNEYLNIPEVAAEIREVKSERVKALLKLSDINDRWYDRKLETFEPMDKSAKAMKQVAIDYISHWKANLAEGRGLYYHGSVGTGKTHIVCAIAQELITRYYAKVMYFAIPNLLVRIDPFFKDPATKKLYANLTTCDLLILDDLDKSTLNDYSLRFLYMIVNDRYENKKPMFFTSNRDIDELPQILRTANMATSGEAIVDRIVDMCQVVRVSKRESVRGKK